MIKLGNIYIEPWNKKNTIPRLIVLIILIGWFVWGAFIFSEKKKAEIRLYEAQQQIQTKEDNERRMAAYKQRVQQQTQPVHQTQNAVDFVNK